MTGLAAELRGRDADVLIEVAGERGTTWAALSADTSMQGQVWRPMCLSSREDFVQLLINASQQHPKSDLALCWGRRVGLQALSSLGTAAMSSATIKDAMDMTLQLHRLLNTPFALDYVVEGAEVAFRTVYLDELRLNTWCSFHAECLAAICVTALSTMLGREALALRYHTPVRFCGDPSRYIDLLAHQVIDDVGHYRVVYPAAILEEKIISRNKTLAHEHRQIWQSALQANELQVQKQRQISAEVMAILQRSPDHPPSLNDMAGQLSMTERILRRRLDGESLTYRELVQRARLLRAQQLLMQHDVPVEAVSRTMGFADTSNFRKAFKQWTGQAPSAWRSQNLTASDTSQA